MTAQHTIQLLDFYHPMETFDIQHSSSSQSPLGGISTMATTQTDITPPDEGTASLDVRADRSEEEEEGPKYQLRPQTRELRSGFTSTWIDQDDTGDYDPSEEGRKARLLRNRLKLRTRNNGRVTIDISDEGEADDESSPRIIPKSMVTFGFRSEDGKAKYQHLTTSLPTKSEPKHDHPTNCRRLRKRDTAVTSLYDSEWNSQKLRFAPDLPDNLTGHPIARGCWECLGLGLECSLLDDERSWPCAACQDDDHECDLVTPPKLKRACERCKRVRTACSFSYTLKHGEHCQQCMDGGWRCIAGPAKDAIPARIRYDRDWVNDPLTKKRTNKARKYIPCKECLDANGTCSFSADGNAGEPCAGCIVSGQPCTFENAAAPLVPMDNGDKLEKKRQAEAPPPSASPAKTAKVLRGSEGTTRKIETKFCHPVVFNYDDNTNGRVPCHFCAEAGYGIFGLGAKEVKVIDWEDGRGLEEIGGGHKAEGVENTRMCASCTLIRLTIIMCAVHQLRPIAGTAMNALDMNTAFAELMSGTAKVGRKWCAVCPSLAQYECCSFSDAGSGCGLMLCELCTVTLTGIYDGDLQKMLPDLKDEPTEQRILGLRADFELLKQDGLLLKYVLWASQQ